MIFKVLQCLYCQGINIVKNGKSPQGKQRFLCRESLCDDRTFILDYANPGQSRQVKEQIVDMVLNGSGIRDTARVLHVSTSTVIEEFKKKTSAPTSQLVSFRAIQSRTT